MREFIHHPGAVLVVPLLDNGRLILERQFRYPLGRTFIEFPAGKIDPGENPLQTGKRELREETGYTGTDCATSLRCILVLAILMSVSSSISQQG